MSNPTWLSSFDLCQDLTRTLLGRRRGDGEDGEDVEVSLSIRTAVGTTVIPTVVLGTLSLSLDPTTAVGTTVGATVVLGSQNISLDPTTAVGETVAFSVAGGGSGTVSITSISAAYNQICCDDESYTISGTFPASGNTVKLAMAADGSGDSVTGTVDAESASELTVSFDATQWGNRTGSFSNLAECYLFVANGANDDSWAVEAYAPGDWYFAATGNDDTGDGSKGSPYETLEKMNAVMTEGNVAYFRGGPYDYSGRSDKDHVDLDNSTGSSGNELFVASYPNEWAIFDAGFTTGSGTYEVSIMIWSSHWHFRDFEVTRWRRWAMISGATGLTNMTFDRIVSNIVQGTGIYITYGTTAVVVKDCVAYRNYSTSIAGDSDGFGIGDYLGNPEVDIYRCVAVECSDDGIDLYGGSGCTLTDSYAIDTGQYPSTAQSGNGNGLKLAGSIQGSPSPNTCTGCYSWGSKRDGIDSNTFTGTTTATIQHCTSYGNDRYGMQNSGLTNTWTSNITISNTNNDFEIYTGSAVDTYNSWNDPADAGSNNDFPLTLTDIDFKSTTPPTLSGTGRARLGWFDTLETSDFLKLNTATSKAIDAGHDGDNVGADK